MLAVKGYSVGLAISLSFVHQWVNISAISFGVYFFSLHAKVRKNY